MISLLKSKGYKLTKNETLGNREFRESMTSFEPNEDESTFASLVYDTNKEFELFLDGRTYSEKKLLAILDDSRGEGFDEITADVQQQERGFMITFKTKGV